MDYQSLSLKHHASDKLNKTDWASCVFGLPPLRCVCGAFRAAGSPERLGVRWCVKTENNKRDGGAGKVHPSR